MAVDLKDAIEIPTSKELIYRGADSEVFKVGQQVLKHYYESFHSQTSIYQNNREIIPAYVDLTNKAADYLIGNSLPITLDLAGKSLHISHKVVPIDSISYTHNGYPITYSRYIEGPTLLEVLIGKTDGRGLQEIIDHNIKQETQDWYTFLDHNLEARDKINAHLESLSHTLDTLLNSKGVNISLLNIKPKFDLNGKLLFLITDLGNSVKEIIFPKTAI